MIRPNRESHQLELDGLEGLAGHFSKWVFGSGEYELPATPVANPEVVVSDVKIKKSAMVMVSLCGMGGLENPLMVVNPASSDITSDGEFTFSIFTDGEVPDENIKFNYVAKNI